MSYNIVLFLPNFSLGGVEISFCKLGNTLANGGHKVSFVCGLKSGEAINRVKNLQVYELGYKKVIGCIVPLVSYLLKEKPDFIITGMVHCNLLSVICIIICRIFGVRIRNIITLHSNVDALYRYSNIKDRIYIKMSKYLYYYSTIIVGVSQEVLQAEIRTLAERSSSTITAVIPNIVCNKDQITSLRFKKNLSPIKFLYVGRLSEEKNLKCLIDWFNEYIRLNSKNSRDTLSIVGNGYMYQDLKTHINNLDLNDKIFLKGFISDTRSQYLSHDVFILNSHYEGLPNVLIEALSWGCLVISNNCKYGPREILKDKYGFIFKKNNKNNFLKLINDTIHVEELKYDVLEAVLDYTDQEILQKYNKLFHKVYKRNVY